ncbi:hypothetical protein HHK36_024497 [Tetracentron sinense]|uniref:Pectinesterase inhibitor domain-containing protein n=1 Tax=Tetracentron sinense TaxID=13715 RepID=A0A834YQ23_TETSI|nr:hypothetical protein HHK36_024497 [Tetracentron sinense]
MAEKTQQLLLVLLLSLLPAAISASSNATDFIRASCVATLYPDLCYSSLYRYANAVRQSPAQLARVAVSLSLSQARRMASYLSNLSSQPNCRAEPRAAAALHDCFATFGEAVDQMRRSLKEMRHLDAAESFIFQMSNVQTWMSAALTNEETCTDEFEDVLDGPMRTDVSDRAANVKKFTSNALALVNSFVTSGTPP